MTTTSDRQAPDDGRDEGGDDAAGPAPSEGAPGVELGRSDGGGGTFEPEEDTEPGA
jgi:hypothetical protein